MGKTVRLKAHRLLSEGDVYPKGTFIRRGRLSAGVIEFVIVIQ